MDSDPGAYVTQRVLQLQGGRLLPLAALFALTGVFEALQWVLPGLNRPHLAGQLFSAGFVVAVAASYAVAAWYKRRFSAPTQRIRDSQLWPLALSVACVILAFAIQEKAKLPFSLPAAVVALLLASFGAAHYSFRSHYLAAGAVCGALAFLKVLGVPAWLAPVLFDEAVAAAITIVAVGDHRLLTTTLHAVPTPHENATFHEVEAGV